MTAQTAQTAQTALSHEPWCRDHHHASGENFDHADWCQNTVLDVWRPQDTKAWLQVTVEGPTETEAFPPVIDVYAECKLDPSRARQLAAALTEAAALLEAAPDERHAGPR